MRRLSFLALLPPLTVLLLLLAAFPSVALAQNDGHVRVAHLSPDAPAVDVYVDGNKVLSNVPYKAVSNYLPLPAGSHTFKVTPNNQPTAVITANAMVEPGKFYTVAAIGPVAQIKGVIFTDDLSAPQAGGAKVRAVHAAVGAPSPVDVLANGKPAFTGLTFASATEYTVVPAGTYTLGVAPAGSTTAAFSATATLSAGDIYTAFAVGNGSSQPYGLLLTKDSAAAGMSGGAAAGGGWLATHHQAASLWVPGQLALAFALAALALCIAGTAVLRRRLRGGHR